MHFIFLVYGINGCFCPAETTQLCGSVNTGCVEVLIFGAGSGVAGRDYSFIRRLGQLEGVSSSSLCGVGQRWYSLEMTACPATWSRGASTALGEVFW